MKYWSLVVAGLYGLILTILYPPLCAIAFSSTLTLKGWPTVLGIGGLMALAQFALLQTPVRLTHRRPVTRMPLLFTVIAAGLAMALLVTGFVFTMVEVVSLGSQTGPLLGWLVLLAIVGSWVFWALHFHRLGKRGQLDPSISRIRKPLLVGSVLELLVAVPTHIVARQRHECCAGMGSFLGLVTGISVMLFAYGPAVYFLYTSRWQRVRPSRSGKRDQPTVATSLKPANEEFTFSCPHCQQHISANPEQAGWEAPCPGCQQVVTVPSSPATFPQPEQSFALTRTTSEPDPHLQAPAFQSGTAQPPFKWLPIYVIGSSAMILILLCVLLLRGSPSTASSEAKNGSALTDSLRETRKVTEELEKQRQLQAELVQRQKEDEEGRLRSEGARQKQEAARRKQAAAEEEQRQLAAEERRKKEADDALLKAAAARVTSVDTQISQFQQSLNANTAASQELSTNVENYLLDHKMATAALALGLGGASVALDSTNHFSADAKAAGAVGTGIVLIWLASDGDNIKEVVQVGSELAKASNSQDRYLKNIDSLKQQIAQKQGERDELAKSIKCPSCSKEFFVVREYWHKSFSCPFCRASLTLTNPAQN